MADRTPLYAIVGLYLVGLIGVAVHSFIKGRKAVTDSGGHQDAAINEHFLASKSFGTVVLFLTTFSTIISGYTAFGIPQEASSLGFFALRWLQGFIAIIIGYVIITPRFRRLAIARNWQSSNDILADRWNSNAIRLLGALAGCLPLILYITAQFISLKSLVSQLSLGEIDGDVGVWFLVMFIWVAEVIGGFRGVSLTDAIQSGIMLIAFLGMPFLLLGLYGGMAGINSAENYPQCPNSPTDPTGCIGLLKPHFNADWPVGESDVSSGGWTGRPFFDAGFLGGCALNISSSALCPVILFTAASVDGEPLFSYVPLGMLSFSMALSVSVLQPHWAQRIISAKSDRVVKKSLSLTAIAIFIAVFPGVLLGLTRAAIIPDTALGSVNQALPYMLGTFYDMGGFPGFFGTITAVASVAAFMSTADSAAIGFANVIVIEFFQNWLTPNMSSSFKIVIAKLFSLFALVSARMLLYLDDDFDILTALNWQIGLGWAAAPSILLALFGNDRDVSAYSLFLGIVVHYIILIILETVVVPNGDFIYIYSGLWCVLANFIVVFASNRLLPDSLKDDASRTGNDAVKVVARERFGGGSVDHLTSDKVAELMEGTDEPVGSKLGSLLLVIVFVMLVFSLPWYGKEGWDYTNGATGENITAGMPTWAIRIVLMAAAELVLLLFIISLWKTDDTGDVVPGEAKVTAKVSE